MPLSSRALGGGFFSANNAIQYLTCLTPERAILRNTNYCSKHRNKRCNKVCVK